jgi:hypothetical protein
MLFLCHQLKFGEIMSNSEPELWSLSAIRNNLDENSPSGKYFIQIPKFQRSWVWKDSQIKKLIDSIYKGFPIGSLLAYKTDQTRSGKPVIQLVDGLQRVTAISRYLESPLKYAPIETFISKQLTEKISLILFDEISEESSTVVNARIRAWFDSVTVLEYGSQYNFAKLANFLTDNNAALTDKLVSMSSSEGLGETLLGEVLRNAREITEYRVPVSIYSGPIENVPTIFERINSQGAHLTKYQIFAASWSRTSAEIKNVDVIEAIAQKYAILIKQGYEVDGFEEDGRLEENEYNLYEYLFGLGKVLANKFPTLFHSIEQPDDNSPVAFQIFTVALRLPVAKMASLAEKMPRLIDGRINVLKLETAVLEACRRTEAALSQFLSLRLNEQNAAQSGVSQNQAISYITSFIANCYDEEFNSLDAKKATLIQENIPGHFLIDVLRGSWSGSGDSTLYERTWESVETQDKSKKVIVPSAYYMQPIGAKPLRSAFNTWHAEQLESKQSQRVRYPKDFKPVLKFIYSSLVTSKDDRGVEFELEHVYPVASLKKLIADKKLEGLPMAAIGNLMLLPKSINRGKRAIFLGDYALTSPKADLTSTELATLQRYLLAPDLTDVTSDLEMSVDSFRKFCELREQSMADHLIEVLKLK